MRKQVLLLDNYDSFTWNLVHLLESCGSRVEVVRNDESPVGELLRRRFTHLVISPGPGTPSDAGISCELIQGALGRVPILGVCLGHQALAVSLGAALGRVDPPIHGEATAIVHSGKGLFTGLQGPLRVARYHSLVVDESSLPPALVVDARSDSDAGLVMAIRHHCHPAFGLQFHPESFLTERGRDLVSAFLEVSA
jgi:anthranilate synthase/aminodeoxychorismate synthase-like glutamine amidotransferase